MAVAKQKIILQRWQKYFDTMITEQDMDGVCPNW